MTSGQVWIGTSWKMNKTIPEAREYVTQLLAVSSPSPGVQAFILPAHTALAAVRDCLPPDEPLLLGAQNAHWEPEGAATGEVSMRMVRDAGAQIVEMGHSERRARFGETDDTVARKARAALDHGLIPLICLGEPRSERDGGRAETFVADQLAAATALLDPGELPQVLVAYEPIWAIGDGGRPAALAEVTPVMRVLAETIGERSPAGRCRALLYGGGVHPGNAGELLDGEHIDGLFVGRAAWSASGLLELLEIGAAHAAARGTHT